VALDALWYPAETAAVLMFDESGKKVGNFGGTAYSNRWSVAYMALMTSRNSTCPSPDCVMFYDAVPLLSKLAPCPTCPDGFQASAWNAWGYLPPVTTFSVPLAGMPAGTQQAWLDLMVSYISKINFPSQYYDKGQEIICTAIMGGKAWMPV